MSQQLNPSGVNDPHPVSSVTKQLQLHFLIGECVSEMCLKCAVLCLQLLTPAISWPICGHAPTHNSLVLPAYHPSVCVFLDFWMWSCHVTNKQEALSGKINILGLINAFTQLAIICQHSSIALFAVTVLLFAIKMCFYSSQLSIITTCSS